MLRKGIRHHLWQVPLLGHFLVINDKHPLSLHERRRDLTTPLVIGNLTIVGGVFAGLYIVCLIVMLKPAYSNIGMIGQLLTVCASFSCLCMAYAAQQASAQLYPEAWEETVFSTCEVTISPLFAHNQILYVLSSQVTQLTYDWCQFSLTRLHALQALLLFLVFMCSTTWYCYLCGACKLICSLCTPDTSGGDRETSTLLMANRSVSKPARGVKRILMLISDTGGGHRASAKAIHDALEREYPGQFEVQIHIHTL